MSKHDMDEIAAVYVSQIDRMKKLKVRPDVELPTGWLLVDAGELVESENDVRFWRLKPVDGEWLHPESGEQGPLSETLRGIACCYPTIPEAMSS